MKFGALREAAGLSLVLGVRLPGKRKQRKGMWMTEVVESADGLIAGGEGEMGRERDGRGWMGGL